MLLAASAAADPGPPPAVQDCGEVKFGEMPLSTGRMTGHHMACREARRIVKECGIEGHLRPGWSGKRARSTFTLRRDAERRISVVLDGAEPPKLSRCLRFRGESD